jgi:uncharacterized protein (TIGR00369 family)
MKQLEARNPDFKNTIIKKLEGQHFMHLMGFDLTEIEAGRVEGEMLLKEKHLQQFGYVHGGVITTISDITMGFAAYSLVPLGSGTVTATISVDFLNPGEGEKIKAIGKVEKAGSKLFFCTGEVWCTIKGKDKLVATAKSVMAVVPEK